MGKGVMHELLAVAESVKGNYGRDRDETIHVLKKAENFRKEVTNKSHFAEDDKKLDTRVETEIVTTVPKRIQWHGGHLAKFLDVEVQKDMTNQSAVADIVLEDGTVLMEKVPATTLLMLESKLGVDFRKVLEAMPTLDSGTVWKFDLGEGLYSTVPPVTFTTRKTIKAVELSKATDKHPAQVEKVTEDVPVAKVEKVVYSGMITSTAKAEALAKLDTLVAAVKKARQRANQTEVKSINKFGDKLIDFITADLKLGA